MKTYGTVLAFTTKTNPPRYGDVINPNKNMIYKQIHSYKVKEPKPYVQKQIPQPVIKKSKGEKKEELQDLMSLFFKVKKDQFIERGLVQPALEFSPYSNDFDYTNKSRTGKLKNLKVNEAVKKEMAEQSSQTKMKLIRPKLKTRGEVGEAQTEMEVSAEAKPVEAPKLLRGRSVPAQRRPTPVSYQPPVRGQGGGGGEQPYVSADVSMTPDELARGILRLQKERAKKRANK